MDHHPHHQLTDLAHPKPHIFCTEAPGKARKAKRVFVCCPEHRLTSTGSFPLSYSLLPGRGRMQDPFDLVVCFFSGVCSCFCVREDTAWFHQSFSRRSDCDTAENGGLLIFLSEVNFRCITEVTSVYLL